MGDRVVCKIGLLYGLKTTGAVVRVDRGPFTRWTGCGYRSGDYEVKDILDKNKDTLFVNKADLTEDPLNEMEVLGWMHSLGIEEHSRTTPESRPT